jgi:prephenate dehydrogenase
MRAIDEGSLDPKKAVTQADLVFIATPVSKIVSIAAEITPFLKKEAILTDVGSTKARIVSETETMLPPDIYFIGGHPMAGSERSGIGAASADLFRNAPYILTPTTKTNMDAFQKVHGLLTQIGARVISLNPKTHDEVVAIISHLPHVVSSALVDLAVEQRNKMENILLLAAGGFYDMTRIAVSNPEMWVDICLENRQALSRILKAFGNELEQFTRLIEEGNREELAEKLKEAQRTRQNLPRISPADIRELHELTIAVSNKPGVISDITLAIGEMGINIEDIEIVHSTEADSGFLKLVILGEDKAKRIARLLQDKGYHLSLGKVYE